MGYVNLPISDGVDWQSYVFNSQFPRAIAERVWAAEDSPQWPRTSHVWSSGTITGASDNGDGTFTITHASDGTTGSRWHGYTGHSPTPADYDLIIDDRLDETVCIHVKITADSTATTLVVDSTSDHILLDWATSAWLYPNLTIADVLSSLVGRSYYIIQRGGIWWHERWLQWPNDQESWVSTTLAAGANQPVTLLTSSGTTATATVPGHQFLTSDNVTVAGATSTNGHFNGTFSVTVLDADTFTYTLAGTDDATAGGSPTANEPHVGAHDPTPNSVDPSIPSAFKADLWKTGHVLMVRDATTGYLLRLTLTGNTPDSLLYDRQTNPVGGQYAVMPENNADGEPSRYRVYSDLNALCGYNDISIDTNPLAGPPWRWYHGAWVHYFSRKPDDTIGTIKSPAASVTLFNSDGTTRSEPLYEQDVWTDFTDAHNPPDKSYNPDLPRTIRFWQKTLEDLCTFFVENKSYEGATAIPNLVPATFFNAANIGLNFSGTTGSLSGSNINFGTAAPFYPINCYYAVLDSDGSIRKSGTGSLQSSSILARDTGSFDSGDVGKPVYVALGWTRWYEYAFRRMFTTKCFVPSPDGSGNAKDPPTATYPGRWIQRSPSTKYKEHNSVGLVDATSEFRNITDGDYARYDGDNFWDPTIYDDSDTPIDSTDTHSFQGYWNNFYEGTLNPAHQAALLAMMAGTVTASEATFIEDSGQNWWPGGYYDSGDASFGPLGTTVADLGGTVDGSGTTTEITDSSKAANNLFSLSTGGMLGFIVEVIIGGNIHRRRIFAHPSSGCDLFIDAAEPLPSSPAGSKYQVRWPKYRVNQWGGLTLHMTYPDGTTHDVPITANDDKRLYFSHLASAPPVGTTYQIQGYRVPGGVWKRQGGAWVKPTGNDPRTGVAWHSNQSENHPQTFKNYGRFNNGDMITETLYNEMWQGINALSAIPQSFTWTADGATNYFFGQDTGNTTFSNGSTGAQDRAKSNYAGSGGGSGGTPFAESYTQTHCAGSSVGCYDYAVGRRFSKGTLHLDEPQTRENCAIDWYVYCLTPNDPATGGSGQADNISCPTIAVFDDNGTGALEGEYHMFSSDAGAASATRVSGTAFGDGTVPTDIGPAPADCSGSPGSQCSWAQGYVATKWLAVKRYNVSGGYVYQ